MRKVNWVKIRRFIARSLLTIVIGVVVFLLVSMGKTIRDISKENRQLNQQNLAYMRCLATVFATYTQNGIPVTIDNLDKCTVRQVDGSVVPVTSLPSASGGSSVTTKPAEPIQPSATPPQTTIMTGPTTQPTQEPAPPEPVRVGPVPICLPDPLSLIKGGLCVTN